MINEKNVIRVVQCWDDGVTDDIRLIEILRAHGARASFNLNFGLHGEAGSSGWRFKDVKDVHRLPLSDLRSVYDGFLVANHTLTHPWPTKLEPTDALREIRDGRDKLEQHFGYEVTGFAYPFGDYNAAVEEMVRQTGHCYARTVIPTEDVFPNANPMAFHANCRFNAPDFWQRFEHVAETGGVFYFWGHSYEMVTDDDWSSFTTNIARLTAHPRVEWVDLPSLFT